MKLLIASVQEYINQISIKEIHSLLLSYLPDSKTQSSEVKEKPLIELIDTYQKAWPLLTDLKKHGAGQLINILEKANQQALNAFAEITKGTEFEPIVSPFLIENIDELEAFDRSQTIKLLNRPDLHIWFRSYLDTIINKSTELFSIQILLKSFTADSSKNYSINKLDAVLADDHLAISPESLCAIINYYEKFPGTSLKDTNQKIHQLIGYFFNHSDLEKQIQWIRGLSKNAILKLIDFYLTTANKKAISEQILSLLCSEWIIANPDYIKDIRLKLEFILLQSDTLFDLATSTVASSEKHSQDAARNSAVAILLGSPRFISTCSPDRLKNLIESYRLYSLTLSMKEFAESEFIKSLGQFPAKIQDQLRQVETALAKQDETSNTWLTHKARLMQHRANESVAALLRNLEQQCTSYNQADANTSKLALTSLYQYYCNKWPSIPEDMFIRIIYHFYSDSLLAKIPDFQKNTAFISWLESLLSTYRQGLTKSPKCQEFCLYDADGQMVGDSGADNQADTLTTQALTFLLQAISEWELSKYPEIFNMLLRQSLLDGSIAEIYINQLPNSSQSRLPWLERQITDVLTHRGFLHQQSINPLFQVLREEYAFELLGLLNDKTAALELFSKLLNNECRRNRLLLGLYASDVHRFLNKHDPAECLAYCILNYYKTPWIFDLIQLFNFYGRKNHRPYLLMDALSLIARQSTRDPEKAKRLDAILLTLIKSDQGMHLLLKELNVYEKKKTPDQDAKPEFNQHFNKTHLLATIKLVNKASSYEHSEPYQFLSYLLANNQDALFQSGSSGYDTHDLFTTKEINLLIEFTNRQLKEPPENIDNQLIGHRMLSDLLFRSARKGATSLFYSSNTFNPSIARRAVMMPYFKRLIYNLWLPEEVKKLFPSNQSWTDNTKLVDTQLQAYPLLFDLFQLCKQIWSKAGTRQLPIICVYLLSYQGEKKPLLQLLNDYINYFQNKPAYIHVLGKLLSLYPERQVSAAIYEALEAAIIRNPKLLDTNTYGYLANYFVKQSGHEQDPKLDLLKHWGQNKHYTLVHHVCNLMITERDINSRLYLHIRNEAKVENQISAFQQGFLFNLITLIMRFWHYGWSPEKNRSTYVKPFDDQSPSPHAIRAPERICSPVVGTNYASVDREFAEKCSQFFRLLNTIARGPRTCNKSNSIAETPQSFFENPALRTYISEVYTQELMMPI